MNEQMQELGKRLLKRADLVTIGLFVGLLIGVGFFWLQEENWVVPPFEPPAPPPWNQLIPSANYETVKSQFVDSQPQISEDPKLRRIVQINMFDLKSVRSQGEMEKELQRDYEAAAALFAQKDYDGALQKVNSILTRNPDHTRSLELRQQIEQAKTPAPAEGAPEAAAQPPAQ